MGDDFDEMKKDLEEFDDDNDSPDKMSNDKLLELLQEAKKRRAGATTRAGKIGASQQINFYKRKLKEKGVKLPEDEDAAPEEAKEEAEMPNKKGKVGRLRKYKQLVEKAEVIGEATVTQAKKVGNQIRMRVSFPILVTLGEVEVTKE